MFGVRKKSCLQSASDNALTYWPPLKKNTIIKKLKLFNCQKLFTKVSFPYAIFDDSLT